MLSGTSHLDVTFADELQCLVKSLIKPISLWVVSTSASEFAQGIYKLVAEFPPLVRDDLLRASSTQDHLVQKGSNILLSELQPIQSSR